MTEKLKILILLLYYERPVLVQNALKSVLKSNNHYIDWHLAVIDDSSPTPVRPIAEEILHGCLKQVSFYHTAMTVEEKKRTGGLVGKFMNQAIQNSYADIAVILCDDDELVPDYLAKLNEFFTIHNRVPATYSHVHLYNPVYESSDHVNNLEGVRFNKYTSKINMAGKVDAAQVAWRTYVNKKDEIWFEYPKTKSLDEAFFMGIAKKYGRMPFSYLVSQFKSDTPAQLNKISEVDIWNGQSVDYLGFEKRTKPNDILPILDRYCRQGKFNIAKEIKKQALQIYSDNVLLLKHSADKYAPVSKCPFRSPIAISQFIQDIIKNKIVCELGCAEGDNLFFMSRFAKSVWGLELDSRKCEIAQRRGLDVIRGDYKEIEIPDADIYYFWPTIAEDDDEYLVHKLLSKPNFVGTIIVGGDKGFPKEIPCLKKCAELGRLVEVPFNEGQGHRENGIFLLAIIDAQSARLRLAEINETMRSNF